MPKMKNNNYIHHVPYLRNSIAYDHDFWYTCLEWWYLQVSAANKYYSSAGHHEQKNKKTTDQIKFLLVTIKQQMKLVLRQMLMYWFKCCCNFIHSISCLVKICMSYDVACKFFYKKKLLKRENLYRNKKLSIVYYYSLM